MHARFSLILVLMALFVANTVRSMPPDDDLKKKQSQLEKLKKDIDKYEERIKERERKEHATLDLLDTYDRQAILLRKLIAQLHDQETSLEHDIGDTRYSIGELHGQTQFIKEHYARYISTAYKHGQTYDLELLLSSKSFNQLLIRSEYLKRFSEQRKKDLDKIDGNRIAQEEKSSLLQQQLSDQRRLLAEKQKEEGMLAAKTKKRKSLLTEIRRDKKNFKQEINRKLQAARDLEQLIAKLIDEDRVKKEREKHLPKDKRDSERETITGGAFESKRGRLRWPVAQGRITARFGNQENPTLHTVTQNTGIDIAVPAGTGVNVVADGEVSKIYWLPSFGNLVILNHRDGFRTVYAHLSEISVSEGDKLSEGARIGKSGEALSGSILHFEIYKDREKQDPEQWLHPKGLTQR